MPTFLKKKTLIAIVGYLIIGAVTIPVLLFIAIFGFEQYLTHSSNSYPKSQVSSSQIGHPYLPFSVQHLNPFYLFFFPFNVEKRISLSNTAVTLTAEGYRGDGPAARGERKLAFLLGGSTAFGYYASNDHQTISGWLNQLQSTYHFVNAGVPSFNSTQELFRVINEVLPQQPKLLISLNGANDFAIPFDNYFARGVVYPAGTPESYHNLHSLVENIRAQRPKAVQLLVAWYRWFPETSKYLREHFTFPDRTWKNILIQWSTKANDNIANVINLSASKYIYNMEVISQLCTHSDCAHVNIFQPMAILHEREDVYVDASQSSFVKGKRLELAQLFLEVVSNGTPTDKLFWDFSRVFDRSAEKNVFLDSVHLTDVGNKLVAQEILHRLKRLPVNLL